MYSRMTATRTHHEVSCSATVGVGATATMVAGYRAAATKCDQTDDRRSLRGPTAICASRWTYPTSGDNHRPDTYYILVAGTAGDFCSAVNATFPGSTPWP